MHRWPLLGSAFAISTFVCLVSGAQARERPISCDPPSLTIVARGTIVGGKLCNGVWGCRCAHWSFCPAMLDIADRSVVV